MIINLKKILIFILIIKCFAFFISCEATTSSQKNTVTQNQSLITGNTKETSKLIMTDLNDHKLENDKNEIIIEIGLMLPLSGKHYLLGRSLLNSAQLALKKTNQKNIIFHIIDTGNEESLLTEVYNLLEKDIEVFIGPVFTNKIIQLNEILKEKKIPMITLSNNSILEEVGVSVFGLTLEDEINTLLNYSISKDLNRYAVIIPKNEYGKRVEKETETFRSRNNLSSFKYVFYDPLSPNFYDISKKISNYENRKINLENKIKELENENSDQAIKELKKLYKMDTYGELDFEALLIFTQSFEELSNLSSILPYYDVDPKKIQYMGNSLWAQNLSLKEPGLDNSFFTSFNINNKKKFEEEYFNLFKSQPHSVATLVYDLVGLISKFHSKEKKFKIERLYTDSGFIGINGWFKINKSGKVLRNPNIYKIKNQKFILLN